jgi:hypothetical protein
MKRFADEEVLRADLGLADCSWQDLQSSCELHCMNKPCEPKRAETAAKAGIGFGCALAIVLSWTANHAVGWAVIHGLLGWFYVIYFLITNHEWTWF